MTVGTAFFGLELFWWDCEDLWGLLVNMSGSSLFCRLRSFPGGGRGAGCFSRLRCGSLSRSRSGSSLDLLTGPSPPALDGLGCSLLLLSGCCCCCRCLLGLGDSLGGDLDNSIWDKFRSPEAAAATVTDFPFIGLLTAAADDDGGERDCCSTDDTFSLSFSLSRSEG